MKFWIYILFIGLWSSLSGAHPVSFKDSLGVMGSHSGDFSHIQTNYSVRHWFAPGLHHFNFPGKGKAQFISTNFLLKRWNAEAFQANLYLIAGVGESDLSGTSRTRGLGRLQFDIEDRDYYFLAKHGRIFDNDFEQTTVRIGASPYKGSFTELNSWLIFEWQRFEILNEGFKQSLTPFIRIFYRNMLFEIGQSFEGESKFNYIIHF